MNEEEIKSKAIIFSKKNRNKIAKRLTDLNKYKPGKFPISVFMAGSPGAGKTEFSKNLIQILEKDKSRSVVRIDADDLRDYIPGYTGNNSHLFQGAVSLLVEKIHDYVLSNKQSFVLDGTFSKLAKAVENLERSITKKRTIFIFYVYQKPEVAWRFTKKREQKEGRYIPKEAFIKHFFNAKNTVDHVLEKFGDRVVIFLVKKDFEQDTEDVVEIKPNGQSIDVLIKDRYTIDKLKELL